MQSIRFFVSVVALALVTVSDVATKEYQWYLLLLDAVQILLVIVIVYLLIKYHKKT